MARWSPIQAAWAALLLAVSCMRAVNALKASGEFKFNYPKNLESTGIALESNSFPGYFLSKFAFARNGVLKAKISATNSTGKDISKCFHIVSCDVTKRIVRDSSYQMKRVSILTAWRRAIAIDVCKDKNKDKNKDKTISYEDTKCDAKALKTSNVVTFNPSPRENLIISIKLVVCKSCMGSQTATVKYNVSMVNPRTRFPYLGWDEVAYPIAPTVIVVFAVVIFTSVIVAFGLASFREKRVPFVSKVVFVTVVLKIISSGLTTAVFWRTATTGRVMLWFFALRVPLIIVDEIMIGLLMLVMSTGVGLMPPSWMFDGRSSTFAIFLGLALEVFTVVTSEVLFMFRYLSLIVFLFSGGTVAFICVLYSWRNVRFLEKYAKLVHLANIYVESTPLLRMSLFFRVNSVLVVTVWIFKVVAFGVMDHVLVRADLLWVCFEAADITLLAWYAFSIFPRAKSAYYVDMSVVDNVRLREVNAWHVRHQPAVENEELEAADAVGNALSSADASSLRTSSAGPLGVAIDEEAGDAAGETPAASAPQDDDPEPPMIMWESGMTLPVPTTAMWNMQDEVRRVLKRQRSPELPDTLVRVLGSPRGSLESLSLTIAKPVIGPDAEKRGPAMARVSIGTGGSAEAVARASTDYEPTSSPNMNRPFADRARPINSESGELGPLELRDSYSAFSDFDYEPFSVPSSNASADGEIFDHDSTKPRRK